METFGKRLKVAIFAAKITQTQLANDVGRTKGAVTQWVQGETEPDLKTLTAICDRLKVSADYLVRGVDTRYLDAKMARIASRMQQLTESERDSLHRLIFGNSVNDEDVEARMPITARLKRPRS